MVSRKRKTKKLQPGGPQPGVAKVAAVQPGIVQAVAAQPGVGQGANPGKSLLKKGSTRLRRKPKDKEIAGANPGGPQPIDAQTGGAQLAAIQAGAAQPGVGRGANPGTSILKKGLKDKQLPAKASPNVFVTLDKAYFPAQEPLFVRNWFIHRPFADKEKGEKELDFVVHETYLTERAPKKLGKVQVVPIRGHEVIFNRVKLEENGIKNEHVEDEFDSSDNEDENEIGLKYWSSDSDDEEALTEGTAVEL